MRRRVVEHRDCTAYPKVTVDGLDLDEESVALARENVAGTEVADRVTFQARDAGDSELAGSYQLVTIFEALHDMSRPVEVLRALRGLLAEDGALIVMDERVADSFTAPGDDIERIMYTYSVLCCLPVGPLGDALGRHRHRHAHGHLAPLRDKRPGSRTSRCSRSSTSSSASTASTDEDV